MERQPNCQIVDNAKQLAIKKDLDPTKIFCPLIHVCNGETCMFNGNHKAEVKDFERVLQIDKFYKKLEKTLDKNSHATLEQI